MNIKKYLSIGIIICMVSCYSFYSNGNSRVEKKELEKLVSKITFYKEDDGGYSKLSNDISGDLDLYTTYYAFSIYKDLNRLDRNEVIKVINKINENRKKFLFNNSKYDNLSEIYFFSKICSLIEYKIKPNDEIIKYIFGIQLENGLFAYSEKHKENIKDDELKSNSLILPTYMALNVLNENNIKLETKNENNIKMWLLNKFDNRINQNLQIESLVGLVHISQYVNLDLNGLYKERFSNEINKTMETMENEHLLNHNLFNIDDVLELNSITSNLKINNQMKHIIYRYCIERRNYDGLFCMEKDNNSDILATYLCLSNMNKINKKLGEKEKILEALEKYKLLDGGFVRILNNESDIEDTYNIFKLFKLIDSKNINRVDFEKFLMKNRKEFYIENPYINYCYLYLYKEMDCSFINKKEINKKIIQLESYLKKDNTNFELILYSIKTIKLIKGENYRVSDFLKNRIREITLENKLINNEDFERINLQLELIKILNIESCFKEYNLDEILTKLKFRILNEDSYSLSYIYDSIYILDEYNVKFNNNEKMNLKKKIMGFKNKNTFFFKESPYAGINNYSFENTMQGYYLLKKLNV